MDQLLKNPVAYQNAVAPALAKTSDCSRTSIPNAENKSPKLQKELIRPVFSWKTSQQLVTISHKDTQNTFSQNSAPKW